MILKSRMICPKSWKCLLLLTEKNIEFSQNTITLNDEVKHKIKYPTIDEKDELFYIFSNLDQFIKREELGILGTLMNEIEGYFINSVVLPIRFERVIKPLVYRELSDIKKLEYYREILKENLITYSEKIEEINKCNYNQIVLSTALAVLDYLGEIQWNSEKIKNLYHWYLKIKSKKTFQIILNETCPGIKSHSNFEKIDF